MEPGQSLGPNQVLLEVVRSPLDIFETPACQRNSLATQAWAGRLLVASAPDRSPAAVGAAHEGAPARATLLGVGVEGGSVARNCTRLGTDGGGFAPCGSVGAQMIDQAPSSVGITRSDGAVQSLPFWLIDCGIRGEAVPVVLVEDDYPGWLAPEDITSGALAPPQTWTQSHHFIKPHSTPIASGAFAPPQTVPDLSGATEDVYGLAREEAVQFALSAAGVPNVYLWGGTCGPDFDCSGLVQRAYAANGVWVPRDAYQQEAFCDPVSEGQVRRGDLVFFWRDGARRVTHVGMVTCVEERQNERETERQKERQKERQTERQSEKQGSGDLDARTGGLQGRGEEAKRGGHRGMAHRDLPWVRYVHTSGNDSGNGCIAEDWLCAGDDARGSKVGGHYFKEFHRFGRITKAHVSRLKHRAP